MPDRRTFVAHAAAALGAAALTPHPVRGRTLEASLRGLQDLVAGRSDVAPETLAEDEAFWAEVRQKFLLRPDVTNLDHGWTNPTPTAAFDALVQRARELQALPAERLAHMWDEVTNTKVRGDVASIMGVPGSELAFVRNATEALDTVLLGLPMQRGDELLCSAHDYYAMLDAVEQRRARDGIVVRMVQPPVPAPSMDALADLYTAALTPRTRLVLLTNPSNLTGQLLPVRRIADAAHAVGAEVVVDGAQSLGLFEEPVAPLGVDYYGASLHKWLGVPVGTGVLWMRPEHVAKVWPLVPPPPAITGMARFEWIGTAPEYAAAAALPALEMHRTLGPARKAARLRFLAGHLRARLAAAVPDARFYTIDDPAMSCGLTTVELPGTDAEALQQSLWERDRILVQAMSGLGRSPGIRGIRVSPNVFTAKTEIDRFVASVARLR